jgi:hypothetical protein
VFNGLSEFRELDIKNLQLTSIRVSNIRRDDDKYYHVFMNNEESNAFKKYSFGITPLLYALAIRYPELNALANEKLGLALMSDYLKNPVQKDSVLSVIGNCGLNKTEIKEILKESDVKYSTVPGKATHLLLGRSLSEDELAIVLENMPGRTLLNESIFFDFCKEIRSFDSANPNAIRQLMMHDDDVNVEIALELMKSTSSPKKPAY